MTQLLEERLKDLLNKQVRNVCTPEEATELAQLIAQSDDKLLQQLLFADWENYESAETVSEDKTKKIIDHIVSHPEKAHKRLFIHPVFRYAAAAAIALLVSFGFFHRNASQTKQTASSTIAQLQLPAPSDAVDYTRNIALPDGSTVILHKGSTLCYNETEFAKTSRELTLSGEAYFDVARNPKQPFIIHSGTVKTTVLGTAFSIQAWKNQKNVVVTVARGKVRVENNAEVLAILTAHQQLDYDLQQSQIQIVKTNVEQDTNEWIKEDMTFNQVSLNQIVTVLEKRYKVNIHIQDKQLGDKIIVSSFSGMENLSGVLDMLCLIMPEMRYEIDNENNITLNRLK
ncbi:MAG: hypothetical protein EZS26_002343 [Candidatus Ordinivivax streblomastigis]|uniref:FecR family protein n=1 Tax=Candidatus Ordinivivax streblomastigis TaxID=2540710 RepID=A0A5M8NZ88_9BACT|nr:MAG: hypothetical protein EZS26_002343 [Candidatus Ordinivivax streblomastigis]